MQHTPDQSNELDRRLDRLERTARQQRCSLIALASILLGGLLLAANQSSKDATFDRIICSSRAVADTDGKVRIVAATAPNGNAALNFVDSDGKPQILVGTVADGSAVITSFGKNGKQRIAIGTASDGDAGISWYDNDGKERIVATTAPDGNAGLGLADAD
ncbi:MAG: hypothetical protein SGJ09_04990 [Phycisphaerae bacterium]|nr:hypothetical protein [Phycisphaerae bacterium]